MLRPLCNLFGPVEPLNSRKVYFLWEGVLKFWYTCYIISVKLSPKAQSMYMYFLSLFTDTQAALNVPIAFLWSIVQRGQHTGICMQFLLTSPYSSSGMLRVSYVLLCLGHELHIVYNMNYSSRTPSQSLYLIIL